ncbi:SUMO protein smt3 [Coemansia sp. RSA 1939]|nr:SUMO protein smt3 [Coemansia sp. RSA 1939]KAJ2594670.1 SUMO protein smt3 [Coemansia sp. RSA 1804]KAJ2683436.1 SUMO protein smt3 [Coemansia sp. RSA 1285]
MDTSSNNGNSAKEEKDTKPEGTSTDHINIKVVSADNSEVMFKIKRSTKLAKLMQAYCARAGKSFDTVRFLVDGERINGDSTPDSLGLEDGDAIDAMTEQIGGCSGKSYLC